MKDALGSVQSILVLGGGSDIARATCKELAGRRAARVVLAARKPEALRRGGCGDPRGRRRVRRHRRVRRDRLRRARAVRRPRRSIASATSTSCSSRSVCSAIRPRAEVDASAAAVEIVQTNFTGVVSVTVPLVNRLEAQGHGTLVLLSSVAGERARRSNFVYGSSKAGVDAFYQGLADALAGSGVQVMIVRPGFVTTKMTEGMPAAPLSTTPEAVATAIARGLERGSTTIWVPAALRFVMSGLRHLPRPVFRRLKI